MFAALRSRNYALFWAGSFASNVGSWVQTVALGWLVYDMTRSATALGLVSFASSAPVLFVGLVAGAIADRADYKTVLAGTQFAAAAAAFLLAGLTFADVLRTWQILAIALASGLVTALYMPVVQAMLPSLVPPTDLLNAVSLNSVNFNLARIVGPILAGFAYTRIGPTGCFVVNGISFLVLIAAYAQLRLPARPTPSPSSLRRQLLEGILYARSDRLIVAVLILGAGVSILGFPYVILMPAIARDFLQLGPDGLGVMMGIVGVGAVSSGLGLASYGHRIREGRLALLAGAALALCLIGFSYVTSARAAAPFLLALGFSQVACVTSLNTALQVRVSNAMRGRVMSMLTFSFFGLSTLGSLLIGRLGDAVGIERALRAGGFGILSIALALWLRAPEILQAVRGLEEIERKPS